MSKFLENFPDDLKDFFYSNLNELENEPKIEKSENVTGQITSQCNCGGRPLYTIYKRFHSVTVIKTGNDWTIFGMAVTRDRTGDISFPFVLDLLESQNKFTLKIRNGYPYEARLSNSNEISYRISNNKIIIRCISLPNSRRSCCKIYGVLAAEASELISPEKLLI